MGTPARCAQMVSCSVAAARKVSAAARITLFPPSLKWQASLPMVVVFPTPFTPTTRITDGDLGRKGSACIMSATISLRMPRTASGFPSRRRRTSSLRRAMISSVVLTPMSAPMSTASRSS